MEKETSVQENPLVAGARQSRFIPFWWLSPFICYVIIARNCGRSVYYFVVLPRQIGYRAHQ